MTRNFAAELTAAREAGDWAAHERIWEERRVGAVEADEAALGDEYRAGDKVLFRGELVEVDSRYEISGDYLILCADGLYRQANPLALSRPAGSPDHTAERSALVGGVQLPGTAPDATQDICDMLTTAQIQEVADRHGLICVSVALLADINKFSVSVQWMNGGYRECVGAINGDAAAALNEALLDKAKIDNRSADEKAERAANLRAELASLEQAA